ncbi:pantoate--beta-alanine ligase [Alkalicoccobacillus gibsonii]|uniref:pantoate--beta-alanine ligase n=1 Tax=Alkalicoccobacillus gibsonii TaxID=79881 RepID=UPI0019331969|nr:pantoate--beta-alanine ligase [Alkalicoccobacillus gibsonii]MBM0064675.1 pantoate--beta-alanine ligase [Alkalicoccobacillus gibsonii]
MKVIKTIDSLRRDLQLRKADGHSVGFVPTMGALHEGHLSLIHQARDNHEVVVVSVFVNPLQFGEGEDFESYPRDIERDQQLCEEAGVDILFYPSVEEMYPREASVEIRVVQGVDVLCGKSRPGHFDGVATVVLKLLHMVEPNAAYFGQKDAQQVAVIKQMVQTLSMSVQIIACPTVREEDGLAKSSRNVNLNTRERELAPALYSTLIKAAELAKSGSSRTELMEYVVKNLDQLELGSIDYVDVLTYPELVASEQLSGTVIIAVAYQFSRARLIDHILVEL